MFVWKTGQPQDVSGTGSVGNDLFRNMPPVEKINFLNHLADSLLSIYPEKSLKYSEEALRLSESQNYDKGKLKALILISDIYWGKTDLKNALEYANRAKELAILLDDRKEYANAILIIGKIYTDLGDYDKSSDLNFEALRIFEEEKDEPEIAKALNRIGYVYFDQGNFDKALKYYSQSLAIARKINDLTGIARGLNNVAAVYGSKNELENLELNLREAIKINKKIGRKLWEGINYVNLGFLYHDKKNYDTSYYYYKKAADIFIELNNVPKLVLVYIGLSKHFSGINNQGKSLYYANLAYKLGKDNGLKKAVYDAAARLHDIYKEQNDLENSYKYCTIEYQMKDSLDLEKSMTRLSQLELLNDFEKKSHQMEIEQQRKDYLYIISAIILTFLFVLTIILLIARNRIKVKNAIIQKKQLEKELELKNKEFAVNVLSLMRKNETLSTIAEKLMKIRDEAVKDETKLAIKKISGELKKSVESEIWKEFEIRFKEVHSGFYKKLMEKFPQLSPNEQRLCAFLRLNLSTKEISELTGQSISAIEMARFRLRKKLKISGTNQNLIAFLSQI